MNKKKKIKEDSGGYGGVKPPAQIPRNLKMEYV